MKILVTGYKGFVGKNLTATLEAVRCGADALVTNIYMIFRQPEGITGACRRFQQELGSVTPEQQEP